MFALKSIISNTWIESTGQNYGEIKKRTVRAISSDLPLIRWYVRFTLVPLKPFFKNFIFLNYLIDFFNCNIKRNLCFLGVYISGVYNSGVLFQNFNFRNLYFRSLKFRSLYFRNFYFRSLYFRKLYFRILDFRSLFFRSLYFVICISWFLFQEFFLRILYFKSLHVRSSHFRSL